MTASGGTPNPVAAPISALEQPHFPERPGTLGHAPLLIPHAHAPPRALTRNERRAGIIHLDRLVRLDASTVPEVGVPSPLRGHEDLVGDLARATPACPQHPAQAWPRRFQSERILQILAAEGRDARQLRGGVHFTKDQIPGRRAGGSSQQNRRGYRRGSFQNLTTDGTDGHGSEGDWFGFVIYPCSSVKSVEKNTAFCVTSTDQTGS